jgi:hypothetical protein
MATCRWMRDRRSLVAEALAGIPAVVFFAGKGRSSGMALSESEAAFGTSGTLACARRHQMAEEEKRRRGCAAMAREARQ